MTDQSDQRLPYPPQLVALCQENVRHEAEIVGWAMVFPGRVLCFVTDPTGVWDRTFTFPSLDSAEVMLSCIGIYLVAESPTPPSDPPPQRWPSRLRGSRDRGEQIGRPGRHSGPTG